jgi:hypothetical protein
LTIEQSPTAITITDDKGQSRAFHATGKEEVLRIADVPVGVTTKWEAGQLAITYDVENGRSLRYTYALRSDPRQVLVDVQFIEHGHVGDHVRRVYEPFRETDTAASSAPASAPLATTAHPTVPAAIPRTDQSGGAAPPSTPPPPAFNQQPGAELKGLTRLGVLVEALSPQAATCGLSQEAIESAVSKRVTDDGLHVLQHASEDTYLDVSIVSANPSNGLCVSRYDVSLYTYTTAKLSYGQTPVLVQVLLLHKGGIAGGTPAAHGDAVVRGVQEYVDQFAQQIRDANR